MKYVVIPAIQLIAVVLQLTLCELVAIQGMGINLFLCVTIMLLLMTEEIMVVIGTSAFIGVVYDLCCAQYVGPASVAMILTGFFIYFVSTHINLDNLWPMLSITAVGTLLYNLILWAIYTLLGSPYTLLYVLLLQPVYMIYNMAAVAGLYYIAIKLFWKRGKV